MENLNQLFAFLDANPWLVVLLIIWSLTWKGLALWRSAMLRQKTWFIVLLVINTVGILEIIYLLVTRHRTNSH